MREWTADDLAARCAEAGAPEITRSVIANMESMRRRGVTVDELAAFGRVFGVSPAALLARALAKNDGWPW